MLTGLPIAGAAIGPCVPPATQQEEFVERFRDILPHEPEDGYYEIGDEQRHGPSLRFLKQFKLTPIS